MTQWGWRLRGLLLSWLLAVPGNASGRAGAALEGHRRRQPGHALPDYGACLLGARGKCHLVRDLSHKERQVYFNCGLSTFLAYQFRIKHPNYLFSSIKNHYFIEPKTKKS